MRGLYLEVPHFPGSQKTAIRITFAFSTTRLKAPLLWLLVLLVATIVMHEYAPVVSAQGRIIVMEKDLRRVTLPTTEVTRIAGATRQAESIGQVPKLLEIGDELIGITGAVTVKVRCNNASVLSLSGRFQVRFLRPREDGDCNLFYARKGRSSLDVNAEGPTNIQTGKSGEIRLGSKRTRYVVTFDDQDEAADTPPDVLVFQGELSFASSFFSDTVKAGEKVETERDSSAKKEQLDSEDFNPPAAVQARLDVSQAINVKNLESAYRKLAGLHREWLRQQTLAKLMALFEAQAQLGIPSTRPNSIAWIGPLKPGEEQPVYFNLRAGDCKSPMKVVLTLVDAPFARLLSPAETVAAQGAPARWKIQLSAKGLTPGSYEGRAEVKCSNCSSQRCFISPLPWPIILDVH